VGRGFRSPAQVAASARPPQPSVITAPVRLIRPRTSVVLRGTLAYGGSVAIPTPTSLDGDAPIVTASPLHPGDTVHSGSVLGAVANRPLFALPGRLPAYDDMGYGSTGPDVVELQDDLRALGFETGTDTSGWYGLGTAGAVAAFYRSRGYSPILRPQALPTFAGGRKKQRVEKLATVPRGEVVFIASLPATVSHVASVGSTAGSHGVVALASGALRIRSTTDQNTSSLAHVGELGRAISDQKPGSFRIRLLAISKIAAGTGTAPIARLVFAPTSEAAASRFVGENLALKLSVGGGGHARLVVPVSAVSTQADGRAIVIVMRHGERIPVSVIPGISYAGKEVVRSRSAQLRPGAQVVIGT
jgi:peptidoglycan hydrolase-like protein with peptidoglycan-binding domain